jgi:hypothetical protein
MKIAKGLGLLCRFKPSDPFPVTSTTTEPKRRLGTSFWLAFVLALLFGPFGLFCVSWKRALVILLIALIGTLLFPHNGAVIVTLWLLAPACSVVAFGLRPGLLPSATRPRQGVIEEK